MFSNLNSFKKHITRIHAIENLEDTVPQKLKFKETNACHIELNNTVISQISNQININNTPVQIDDSCTLGYETNSPNAIINIENAINLIYQAGINLTMSLHNNTNLTRKDVVNKKQQNNRKNFLKVYLNR